jgi:D-alanyl-D-alanine dipeptidase
MPSGRTSVSTDEPIPPLSEPPDWGRLPIRECGEPLVPVAATARLRTRNLYAEMGIPDAPPFVRVRAGVLARLERAVDALPPGLALVIFDGFRPLSVQQWLYESFREQLRRERPELSEGELLALLGQYVASPVPDPLRPPPHRTGGAADVYLVEVATGRPLPMGTEPDAATPASATRWFEEHPAPGEPFAANRRTLYHAMTSAGFTNYLGEWWHYDFGNQRWANCAGADSAVYGIAE